MKKKIILITAIYIPIFIGTLMPISTFAQNVGISTDGSTPETGVLLDVKGTNTKATTAVQNIFQIKSYDASTDALKLRLGLATNPTYSLSYGIIEVPEYSGGSITAYRNMVLQPSGGNVGIGTTNPSAQLHIVNTNSAIPTFQAVGSQSVAITYDGRLYGSAIHNNTGAVTGTTNQYIASGTYTPAVTYTLNVDGAIASESYWMRVGNVVTVAGIIDIDISNIAGLVRDVQITLPIATAQSATNISGIAASRQEHEAIIQIFSNNNPAMRAEFRWKDQTITGNVNYSFNFTYVIKP